MIATYSSVVVCPLEINFKGKLTNVLDIQFPLKQLAVHKEVDGELVPDGTFKTFREFAVLNNAEYPKSNDDKYIALFAELSDLANEPDSLKGLITASGVTLAGDDFTQTAPDLCWYLTIKEWVEFRQINPMFKDAAP